MKILIVDDCGAMRMLILRALYRAGLRDFSVELAADGTQALVLFKKERPDLVITDYHMPDMTGVEMIRMMKHDVEGFGFGFLTADNSPGLKKVAAEEGALFVISKPFTPRCFKTNLFPHIFDNQGG